jgi:hypothetical protein
MRVKRALGITATVIVVAGIAVYTFREPLMSALFEKITADMFVASDTDAYDPGPAVGTTLPAIHARYRGGEVTQLGDFMGSKGLALFVNRSVDW